MLASSQALYCLTARRPPRLAIEGHGTRRDRHRRARPLRDRTRRATSTGSSRSTAPIARLAMDVEEDRAAARPATSSSSTATTSASTSSSPTRSSASASSTPRCARVVVTSGKDRVFCSGANIYMLGTLDPRVQGELLQVHQRDAPRPRGRLARTRGLQVARRGQRHLRRAAATSWRSPATRSCSSTTARPRSACPRCRCSACCPAPAASRAWSTSARCAATSPTCSPPSPRASRASARWSGASSTRRCRCRSFAARVAERAQALAAAPPDKRRARASRSTPLGGTLHATTASSTGTSRSQIDAASARRRTLTVRGPEAGEPDDAAGDARAGQRRCGRCARSASSTTRCSTCASTSPRSASSCCRRAGDAGARARRRRARSRRTATTGSCARCSHLVKRVLQAPRPHRAQLLRRRRPGLVLRRLAARARARRRPLYMLDADGGPDDRARPR